MEEVTVWQSRALGPTYPVVFFDALRVKIREESVVTNRAVYLRWACCQMAQETSSACG
jgi:putative transposase